MSILVGVDGSEHADRALAWALREAALRSAQVTVINAFRVRELAGPLNREEPHDEERAEARRVVEEALGRVGSTAPGVDITTTAVTGRAAAEAILHHGRHADLIVVGSRGLGGFPGLLVGSVSQQVAAHADVPVAVIPAGVEMTDVSDGTTSIVVGVDGSDKSIRALRWAVEEARLRDVPLTAVYVYRSLREGSPFDAYADVEESQLEELERQGGGTALGKLDRLLSDAGDLSDIKIEREVDPGSPAKVLISDAADESTLLVVGSRGHGGFSGLLLGSVSQQCLHHAKGPVVVTPIG
ncbi:MAG TPA: universal stress protein [Euzebyales bacterium]